MASPLEGILAGDPVTTSPEFYGKFVDLSEGTSNVIIPNRGILRGVNINTTMNNFKVEIQSNGVTIDEIPAGTPAATWIPFGDKTYLQDITLVYDASATGTITVCYKNLGAPR